MEPPRSRGTASGAAARRRLALAVALASAFLAATPVASADPARTPTTTLFADRWQGLSFGAYLAPKADFITEDGAVDLVFHFHAGQMSEREMKESGLDAVFVSCGFGLGSGAYSKALANPNRFGRMLREVLDRLELSTGRKGLHVGRLALVSWSAGFAAVGKILGVDRYYAMIDSVVLLDSLHSRYKSAHGGPSDARGAENVDLTMMRSFVRFAKDAASGTKAMVVTHSSILPPDYASSAEATQALLTEIGVARRDTMPDTHPAMAGGSPSWRGLQLTTLADAGNLHVRGFRGAGPRDHFEHLHLLGEVLRSWLVPRWKRMDRFVYTRAGEQL